MAATQTGTTLEAGVGATLASYIIQKIGTGNDTVSSWDVQDEDGVLATRGVNQTMDVISYELVSKSGADPDTDFPKGKFCAITALSNLWVQDCQINRQAEPETTSVTLVNIGIT